jgi:uncharacterized protein YcsI (UPF0317 family)
MNAADLAVSPAAVRRAARTGDLKGTTAGLAFGSVQGNVAILPRDWAGEFERFCQRNPRPCPVLAIGDPGDPLLPPLGADVDIRTDCPRYRVFENGRCVDEPYDISRWWRDDLVAFVLGCSFSFEQALLEAGVPLRHIETRRGVPMYRTSVPTVRSGRFHGPLVVSMRPLKPADAIRAIQVTSRFPTVHGAPVHIGLPETIGIRDLARPDWGDALEVKSDELPVFWACGVTPQAVIEAAGIPFSITHYPGSMLVTDLKNSELAVL